MIIGFKFGIWMYIVIRTMKYELAVTWMQPLIKKLKKIKKLAKPDFRAVLIFFDLN